MRPIFSCVAIGVVLVALVAESIAQPVVADERQKAAEFQRLHDAMRQTRDPEERIRLGERALALEADLRYWPLWTDRNRAKMLLHFDVAYAYETRRQGLRADNLEKAITHYQAELSMLSPQAYPQVWAETQHNLGGAYSDRIRGD